MSVYPLIPTEPTLPGEGQMVGLDLNPSNSNVRTAAISVGLIAAVDFFMAFRSPKMALPIMTGTLALSIGAGYVALSRPYTTTASTDTGSTDTSS